MRTWLAAAGIAAVTGVTGAPEVYRVSVTKVDKDLYKIENQRPPLYVETRYCYEYATRDDAILRYERYASNNKLIFSNDTACDVKALR